MFLRSYQTSNSKISSKRIMSNYAPKYQHSKQEWPIRPHSFRKKVYIDSYNVKKVPSTVLSTFDDLLNFHSIDSAYTASSVNKRLPSKRLLHPTKSKTKHTDQFDKFKQKFNNSPINAILQIVIKEDTYYYREESK